MNLIGIFSILATPLGYIMWAFYLLFGNFGWAIIAFAIVVQLLTLPFAIKQQKNTIKSSVFMPRVKEIQTKYRNDKEKQQEELMKLQKLGYNPMGGCVSMLIPLLILFGVTEVVYRPLTHWEHVPKAEIADVVSQAYDINMARVFIDPQYEQTTTAIVEWYQTEKGEEALEKPDLSNAYVEENGIAEYNITPEIKTYYKNVYAAVRADSNSDKAKDEKLMNKLSKKDENADSEAETSRIENVKKFNSAISTLGSTYGSYNTNNEFSVSGNQSELNAISTYNLHESAFSDTIRNGEVGAKIKGLNENMNFLGIPLGKTPTLSWDLLILIPILSAVFSLLQSIVSMKINAKNNPQAAEMNSSMKTMMYIMPLFSLWFMFSVPAGVGFYWIIRYALGLGQTILLPKMMNQEQLREDAKKALEEAVKSQKGSKRNEKLKNNSKYLDKNGNLLPQKEIDKIRLAEARKADAEKYGEEYKEE